MRIAIASDHAGFEYKIRILGDLEAEGHATVDLGADGSGPVDYPDIAAELVSALRGGRVDRGILVCGSAVGVGVAANKFPGVRAGVCHDTYSARQAVEHDDINVLCLGQRVVGIEVARDIVRTFLAAEFSGEERHRRRLEKIRAIEARFMEGEGSAERSSPGAP